MRRTSGPQTGQSNFYIKKQSLNRNRSPNVAKTKSRGKIVQQQSNTNIMAVRKTSSFSKGQTNQSSTFFTTTTQNNKVKKSMPGNKKLKDLKKYEKQIMHVLNQSASIIQRQWRKYLIRKYRKSLQLQSRKQQPIKSLVQLQFDAISARTSQNSQMYNNKKYYSSLQPSKKKLNENSLNKNVFAFTLSSNKQKITESPEKLIVLNDGCGKNMVKNEDSGHNRTRSDQPIKLINDKIRSITKIQQKYLQINPRIVDVVIEPQKQKPQVSNHQTKYQEQPNNQLKYEDHFVKNEKGVLDEILKKIQLKFQQKKLKKILALENSFSNNLMTFRSYKKNIDSVAEQDNKMLTILINKKKRLIDKFNQFVDICSQNIQKIKDDDQISKQQPKQKNPRLEFLDKQAHDLDLSFNDQVSGFHSRSIAFDQWDFDQPFSQKKIVQSFPKTKDSQILIDDSQRQTTIIHDLLSQSKDNKQFENEKKQVKTVKVQISQLPINTPIKQNNQDEEYTRHMTHKNQQQKQEDQKKQIQKITVKQAVFPTPVDATKKQQVVKKQQKKQNCEAAPKLSPDKKNCYLDIQVKKKRVFTDQQVQNQLKKFHPIRPNIQVVNNWLLQISHFILDNFGTQFLQKLVKINQPSPKELWRCCVNGQHFNTQYISVSQAIFKQFQFFHIKTLITQQNIESDKKETYSALMFTFHQALYDSLNKMLLDELIEGRNWIKFPWSNDFKIKKIIGSDHSKQALEKAINRVSNVSDYNIMPIDPIEADGRQFQQTQHNLIYAEQIKQIPVDCQFAKGLLLFQIAKQIQNSIFQGQKELLLLFLQ